MPLDIPQYRCPLFPGRIFSSFPELKEAVSTAIRAEGKELTEEADIPYEFLGYVAQTPDLYECMWEV